nr:flavin reductase [Cupriavidus taiwanensis]
MVDKTSFREAMAGLGAAVNIITSNGEGGLAGCTVSAVCGVTDEPPTLLVCINRGSKNNDVVRENGCLCVNVLAADQQDAAIRFSSKSVSVEERFADVEWDLLVTGAPVIAGTVSALDCEVASMMDVGTHTMFLCEIKAVRTRNDRDALIYFGRNFHSVEAPAVKGLSEILCLGHNMSPRSMSCHVETRRARPPIVSCRPFPRI